MKHFALLALLLLPIGCRGTIPSHYTKLPDVHESLGYRVGPQTGEGFDLRIYFWRYHFWHGSDRGLVLQLFAQVASRVAREHSREIEPISVSKVDLQSSRNQWSGVQTYTAAGRVLYRMFASDKTYRVRVGETRVFLVLGKNITRTGTAWELREARPIHNGKPGDETTVVVAADTVEFTPVERK